MNKFVVFSDMHFHEWTYGSKLVTDHEDPLLIGMNDRLVEQWMIVKEIVKFCTDNNIHDVFFCGDMFHKFGIVTSPVIEIAVRMAKLFHDKDICLTSIVGNHDMYSKDGSRHSLHCVSGYSTVMSGAAYIERSDSPPLGFLPYTEDKEVLRSFLNKAPQNSIVFLHQGVANVPMASGYIVNEILDPSMVGPNISFAFTGHYHANRLVSNNLMVVGSPIQQSYADVGEVPGFLCVDLEQGQIEKVETKGRRFHTIKEDNYIGYRDGDFVRIIGDGISGDNFNTGSKVERLIVPKQVETMTISANPTIRELISKYGEKNKLDTKPVFDVMEDRHLMLKENNNG
jgi:DNA repair exonuclease SbcCD nuclease subunit